MLYHHNRQPVLASAPAIILLDFCGTDKATVAQEDIQLLNYFR